MAADQLGAPISGDGFKTIAIDCNLFRDIVSNRWPPRGPPPPHVDNGTPVVVVKLGAAARRATKSSGDACRDFCRRGREFMFAAA